MRVCRNTRPIIYSAKKNKLQQPGIYENSDLNRNLQYVSNDDVKVINTIDDIRLESNLNNIETLIFTQKKSFFSTQY